VCLFLLRRAVTCLEESCRTIQNLHSEEAQAQPRTVAPLWWCWCLFLLFHESRSCCVTKCIYQLKMTMFRRRQFCSCILERDRGGYMYKWLHDLYNFFTCYHIWLYCLFTALKKSSVPYWSVCTCWKWLYLKEKYLVLADAVKVARIGREAAGWGGREARSYS
jgi:hypothetical protein